LRKPDLAWALSPRRATDLRGRIFHRLRPDVFGPGCRIGRGLTLDRAHQVRLGAGVILHNNVMLLCRPPSEGRPATITIGDDSFFNVGAVVASGNRVDIGADVLLGPYVCVVDEDHAFSDPTLAIARQGLTSRGPISIGDGSWLATGAVVLGGTTIPPGSVVAAKAVVRGHFERRCLLAGAPARVVRYLDDEAER
jgi:acetyltransferase-like isoleucine patch superfamily enzyme